MIKRRYESKESPKFNARILRVIEKLACQFGQNLPNGWQCAIEIENLKSKEAFYKLLIDSNRGNKGNGADAMMETLRGFPQACATGSLSAEDVMNRFSMELTSGWEGCEKVLTKMGMTNQLGGIRVPYEILATKHMEVGELNPRTECCVDEVKGEIRIAFCGETENQSLFYAFQIFCYLQSILNEFWDVDQIWYNLRELQKFPETQFWLTALDIQEASL